jgi:putative DNA primase/helicase
MTDDPLVSTWADLEAILGPVCWSWPGWLPIGMLTILAGESGSGKSALALRLAGCYLRGDPWPDGKPFDGDLGGVLWCEAEAAQALNLDRGKKWGLPLDRIYNHRDPLDDLQLDNPEHLAAMARVAQNPDVRLIVVDSLRGANKRDENSSDTMAVVQWLAQLARDTGKPLLLTHHLRKRSITDNETVELDRLRGSSAIVQPARVIWALDIPDAQQREVKRLKVVKSNLAKFPEPVGMTIDEDGVKFVKAPVAPHVETVRDRAADLLLALLADGPMEATEILGEFDQAGISERTMKEAKKSLAINSVRKGKVWYWSLPARDG